MPKQPSADILPFRATEATLPNGLRVIVVPTGFPNLVSLQIPVQTGSRNEVEPGKSGFAHFFEHMMFRGTERYPADRYRDIVAKTGARQNAYTSDDYTNYHLTFAAEDLEQMLELEADRFMHLSYSEADFKTESRAILGEYNKNSANPMQKLFEVQRDHAFTSHTYKHTVMGFIADIEDMPNQFEYSRLFFDRWYRPEYTTVIVAGDVRPEAVVEWSSGTGVVGARKLLCRRAAGAARARVCHRACPVARRDAALGHGRVPRPGVLGDRAGLCRARHAVRPGIRPDVGFLPAPRRGRAGARPAPALRAADAGPGARHGAGTAEEAR